ncbi:hypothetical protein A0128_02995 [Leptospira tipperaryensis]|uniref:Uncharacterized protein n=1 Tax=Leptospira tipperaryensis TaxID=2564040 RepID=A0A1D7UTI0_9LEPT|nr:hypothetical protein [Leptospira tipperaryensis]AOP32922.1 hypothetical protein A0128_02995 [Leptospira tipperaryensis]
MKYKSLPKQIQNLLYTLSILLFPSCSFLIWKDSSLTLERGWSSSGKEIVQTEVLYEEKDSWNPLSGTTLKRNYRSVIRLFHPEESSNPIDQIPFSSWILPGTVYFHSGTRSLYWIGGKDDQYGSFSRIPSALSLDGKKEISISTHLKPGQIVLQLIPSPDGNSLILVLAVPDADLEFLQPEFLWLRRSSETDSSLRIVSRIPLPEWKETPLHRLRWSQKSDRIYIQISESVYSISKEKPILQKTNEFPLCFYPPTSFGSVGISPADQGPIKMEASPFPSFSDFPKIQNPRKIRDCSSK